MIAKTKAIAANQRRSPVSVPRLAKTTGSILLNMMGLCIVDVGCKQQFAS